MLLKDALGTILQDKKKSNIEITSVFITIIVKLLAKKTNMRDKIISNVTKIYLFIMGE